MTAADIAYALIMMAKPDQRAHVLKHELLKWEKAEELRREIETRRDWIDVNDVNEGNG